MWQRKRGKRGWWDSKPPKTPCLSNISQFHSKGKCDHRQTTAYQSRREQVTNKRKKEACRMMSLEKLPLLSCTHKTTSVETIKEFCYPFKCILWWLKIYSFVLFSLYDFFPDEEEKSNVVIVIRRDQFCSSASSCLVLSVIETKRKRFFTSSTAANILERIEKIDRRAWGCT